MPQVITLPSPTLSGGSSQGAISNQGFTYNEAGKTFNEAGMTFGGFYGYSDVKPLFASIAALQPLLSGQNTLAALTDQGYTYNETGISFNEAGVAFGGVSNENLLYPVISSISNRVPVNTIGQNSAEQGYIGVRQLENGDFRMTENGEYRILE